MTCGIGNFRLRNLNNSRKFESSNVYGIDFFSSENLKNVLSYDFGVVRWIV
jgi:hypothetical protein